MVLEVTCNDETVKRLEKFLNTNKYKELAENAMSFNRKLNEERKTRLPYVDGQTGVAQRHYDQMRRRQERMPGRREGQIVSYPQKRWSKKRYQYLHYFMTPKHLRNELPPPGEVVAPQEVAVPEEIAAVKKDDWEFYDDESYAMQEPIGSDPESDSDFEDYSSSRGRRGKKKGGKTPGGGTRTYKRRNQPFDAGQNERSSRTSRRSTAPSQPIMPTPAPPGPAPQHKGDGKTVICDFCLGDAAMNKKSSLPEELISCAICGNAGHPTCLQFTANMKISVKKYPWQCMECKSCTICGTSENDDKLLFCDDCDRGYHMYCVTPPMREAPEGSWSCSICVNTFHR